MTTARWPLWIVAALMQGRSDRLWGSRRARDAFERLTRLPPPMKWRNHIGATDEFEWPSEPALGRLLELSGLRSGNPVTCAFARAVLEDFAANLVADPDFLSQRVPLIDALAPTHQPGSERVDPLAEATSSCLALD